MIIGFTGTRAGCAPAQLRSLGCLLRVLVGKAEGVQECHHGCAVGADAQFALLAKQFMIRVVGHPSDMPRLTDPDALAACDEVMPPEPPLVRNGDIVADSDALIACPKEAEEQVRSGTWSTVRKARMKEIPVWLILPDGTVTKEGACEASGS